ncbi:MAG: murein biosynthesis integral membrane protein MurJ [Pseudomonadota bacterium]|nr:murein biosynthesis integral membrane protein MurJ [Pseudomonadota bacterium]
MALIRRAVTVGGYTMLSRVLGFLRDILIASVLGAGPVADAFFVSFRIPNMFRRLVAEGAFAAAFVPMFSGRLESHGKDAARAFAEQVLAVLLGALMAFTVAVEIAMPGLMHLIAPGFIDNPAQFDLAVLFTRITFPYLLFMALVALLGGVLNSLYHFAAAAAAPILLNVILIGALLGFAHAGETPGHALAWAVAVAGAGQLVMMMVACQRAGMTLRLPRPSLTPELRRLLGLMVPAGLTAGVHQVNLLVGTIVATLQGGAVSYLYYADRVNQLPLGVVGVAIGTALLPMLSQALRAGQDYAAMDKQNRAIEVSLLFALPAAAALMVIAGPIIAVLFEHGTFGPAETRATAAALAAFALGLPAYVLVKVLLPGFFAREDMTTPFRISLAAVAANIVLTIGLFPVIGHIGIALATALSSVLQAALLWLVLKRRGNLIADGRLRARLPRTLAATLIMAAVLWLLAESLAGPLAGALAPRVAALAALVAGGLVIFAAAAHLLGAARLSELRAMLGRGE